LDGTLLSIALSIAAACCLSFGEVSTASAMLPFMSRRLFFGLLTLLVTGISIEGLSFVALTRAVPSRGSPEAGSTWQAYITNIGASEIAEFKRTRYDPELGWTSRPSREGTSDLWSYSTDALGSRRIPGATGGGITIASYGDSFTFGNEVEDAETYQAFLSRITDATVLNYGVPGYGADQAILRLERHLSEGRSADIVIFGVNSPLRRLWNTYVPFMVPATRIRLGFKPVFVEAGDGFRLVANPLEKLDDRHDLLAALEQAKKRDWFYQHRARPLEFPYSLTAVRRLPALLLEMSSQQSSRPNWNHEPSRRRIAFLLERFYQLSIEADFLPVAVFLPGKLDLRRWIAGEQRGYQPFLEEMRQRFRDSRLVFVDVLDEDFDPAGFHERHGHASAHGNRVTAQAIHAQLQGVLRQLSSLETP
jgi:hypothetical protein